jgi:hypothetical protein
MTTPEELEMLLEGHDDTDHVELTKSLCGEPVGAVVTVFPGVRGKVVAHDGMNADVRVKVRDVRHFLRLVNG